MTFAISTFLGFARGDRVRCEYTGEGGRVETVGIGIMIVAWDSGGTVGVDEARVKMLGIAKERG